MGKNHPMSAASGPSSIEPFVSSFAARFTVPLAVSISTIAPSAPFTA